MTAYANLMLLLKKHGLSDDQAAAFIRMVATELKSGSDKELLKGLQTIADKLDFWLDRDTARQQLDLPRLFGAVVGGMGLGVAGNFVSDLIKGDRWPLPGTQRPRGPERIRIDITPNASRQGLRESVMQSASRHGRGITRSVVRQIYGYAVAHRFEFDGYRDVPWPSPGDHIVTTVDVKIVHALTAWARDRAIPRGILCAGLLQTTIKRELPYWTIGEDAH